MQSPSNESWSLKCRILLFIGVFFKHPSRILSDLPTWDEDCTNEFARSTTTDTVILESLHGDMTRFVQLDLLREVALCSTELTFKAPQWTLNDDLEFPYSDNAQVHENSEGIVMSYTSSKVVKPFVKDVRASQREKSSFGQSAGLPVPREWGINGS